MAEKKSDSRWIVPVAVALVVLLVGAGIGWYARSEEVAGLQEQLDEATAPEAPEAPSEESAEQPETPTEAPPATSEPEPQQSDATASGREFCYVRNIANEAGFTMITVDYAQFLSGDEAATQAAARGYESPPPNDYFIVNDNPLLRTFPVKADITVTLHHGDPNMEAYTVPLGQWQDYFVGKNPGMEVLREVPYWITLENGEVVAIEEQYLP